jgi:hypothetical protein
VLGAKSLNELEVLGYYISVPRHADRHSPASAP